MPYSLAYADRFIRKQHPLTITNVFECEPEPFKPLNSGLNDLRLRLTDKQFTRLWSAMLAGAELLFPDDVNTLQYILLQAVSCPIELPSGSDCIEYFPFAPFIGFAPQNPYNQPDYIPSGYFTPPFRVWSQFETILPDWVDDWLGGLIDWATGYQQGDIVVDISSIPLLANWGDLLTNGMPRIAVNVNGTGVVELHLLAFPLGGRAVITVDVEPNLVDIFNGIIGGDVRIIELNRDLFSVPPETDLTVIEEVEIDTAGAHTIYITFVPAVNDELIPINFGGGFRKVVLCGFDGMGEMGITDIRLTDCGIEALSGGVWTEKIPYADLLECFPSGGGGGGGALRITPYTIELGANQTTTSLTFTDVGLGFNHNFIYSNAVIQYTAVLDAMAGSPDVSLRSIIDAVGAVEDIQSYGRNRGQNEMTVMGSSRWSSVPLGNQVCKIQAKTTSNTAIIANLTTSINILIFEYEEAGEAANFVQNVRIEASELQQQKAGVWSTVSESLATSLNSIAAAAAAAQSTANSAVSVNNTQNTRLNDLEDNDTVQDTAIGLLNISAANIGDRLDNAEISIFELEQTVWKHTLDYSSGNAIAGFDIGRGSLAIGGIYAAHAAPNNFPQAILAPNLQNTELKFMMVKIVIRDDGTGLDASWRVVWDGHADAGYSPAYQGAKRINSDTVEVYFKYPQNESGLSSWIGVYYPVAFGVLFRVESFTFYGFGESPF